MWIQTDDIFVLKPTKNFHLTHSLMLPVGIDLEEDLIYDYRIFFNLTISLFLFRF